MQSKVAKTIRRVCLDCQGGSSQAVAACTDTPCHLHLLRMCTIQPVDDAVRPLRHIRTHCLACAGSRGAVRHCEEKDRCHLWSYRFGVLPATFKRIVARQRNKKQTLLLPGMPSIGSGQLPL